jgi:ABC-2 type transport system permease protein
MSGSRGAHPLAKYCKAFSLGLQSSLEYRMNFLLGFLSFVFTLTIQYFMWTGIFRSSAGKTVYGYTYGQMIVYSFFAALTSKLLSGGFEYGILDDVKSGGLSKFLVKPIGYLRYRLACYLGERSFYSAVILALLAALSVIFAFAYGYSTTPARAGLFLVSVLLALLITFLIYAGSAALSFWMTDASAVFVILGLVINVLSGGIFPLDIFGKTLQAVFSFLPFQYTIYFSVNILCGALTLPQIGFGLCIQLGWIAILFIVTNTVWKIGLKKYVAVGG